MKSHPPAPNGRDPRLDGELGDVVTEDLWSAPGSAVPIHGDQRGGDLLARLSLPDAVWPETGAGEAPSAPVPPRPGPPPQRDSAPGRRRGPVVLALLVAVVLLVGIGYLARQLELPDSPGGGQHEGSSAGDRADLPLSPSPILTLEDARPADPVEAGSADCPMRLGSDGGAGSASAAGERPCFFIE